MTPTRPRTRGSLLILPLIACLAGAGVSAQSSPGQREAPGPVPSTTVTGAGGVSLAVYDGGTRGARSIVFIHGFTQNSMTWQRQFAGPLAEAFHLVSYDFPGHGASEKPLDAERYTDSSMWAEDLAAVIRERNLERPVLVGWSYGGYVIADYLRSHGDGNIGGIVLVASVTKNGTEEAAGYLTEEVLGIFGEVLAPDVAGSLRGTQALTDLFAVRGTAEWLLGYGSAMMVPPPVRAAMFNRVLENDDVLARIRVPTLVIHGRDDRIVRVRASEHNARTIPGARLLIYEGAGHTPYLEQPDRFNRDLGRFVRSLDR
jgi:non-heme chloroperoxidase